MRHHYHRPVPRQGRIHVAVQMNDVWIQLGRKREKPITSLFMLGVALLHPFQFESAALVPTFVASIVAYSIYCSIYGSWGPIFKVPGLQFTHPAELPLYVVLGALCAAVGWLYVKVFYGVRDYDAPR